MAAISLFLIGLIIGSFVIALGGGGAALYLGVLTGFSHLPAATAASTSLLVALPSLMVGAYSNYRNGNMNIHVGNQMLLAALPAVVVGSLVAPLIPKLWYTWIIAAIFVLMGLQILWQAWRPTAAKQQHSTMQAIGYGLLSGLMVGVGGLSGGGPIVAGLLLMGLPTITATATSSYVLVGTSLVGLLFHLSTGTIAWSVGIALMLGAVVGAFIAPFLMKRLTQGGGHVLKPLMGVLLIWLGLKMVI